MQNTYKPEGFISRHGSKQSIVTSTLICDDKIYEGVVKKCDNSLNLWVELSGTTIMIPRDEVCYLFPGEILKDIAIISRVSKTVCFKFKDITKDSDGNDVFIASRKDAQKECIANYINNLKEGDIIDARVTHMEQFGAFCDIGCGISALLSVDSISVSRISHPKDRFSIGDRIRVIVKSKTEDGRVYLTHKELLGTWEENARRFSAGQTVAGIVRSVENYGIFVELTPNLAGLAELRENVYPQQSAAVYIKAIIPERMKIKLVLIDWYDEAQKNSSVSYIGDLYKKDHIESWRYSPMQSHKLIESTF